MLVVTIVLSNWWFDGRTASIGAMSPAIEVSIILNFAFVLFERFRKFAEARFESRFRSRFHAMGPKTTGLEKSTPRRAGLRNRFDAELAKYKEEDDRTERLAKYVAAPSGALLFGLLVLSGIKPISIPSPESAALLCFLMANAGIALGTLIIYWLRRGSKLHPVLSGFAEAQEQQEQQVRAAVKAFRQRVHSGDSDPK